MFSAIYSVQRKMLLLVARAQFLLTSICLLCSQVSMKYADKAASHSWKVQETVVMKNLHLFNVNFRTLLML